MPLYFLAREDSNQDKLQSSGRISTQKYYQPQKAQISVSVIEKCWSSLPMCHSSNHAYGYRQCPSLALKIEEHDRFANLVERDTMVQLFSQHYNMRTKTTDNNGTTRSSKQIHLGCINKV